MARPTGRRRCNQVVRRADGSLAARKELAKDLHYSGDRSDSASMNMWLHKEVLRKLAENGGKVPQEFFELAQPESMTFSGCFLKHRAK